MTWHDQYEAGRIIVFTETFPYGTGEHFLLAELPYLRDAFAKVIIVPCREVCGVPRNIPEGIEVDIELTRMKRVNILSSLSAKRICRIGKYLIPEIVQQLNKNKFWRRRVKAKAYFKDAERTLRWLRHLFENYKLSGKNTLVYTYWYHTPTFGVLLYRDESKKPFNIVTRGHGFDIYEERHDPAYIPFRATMMRMIDNVFPVSGNGSRYLKKKYPSTKDKIITHHLGVENPGFSALPSSSNSINIVTCASLVQVKRFSLFIEGLTCFALRNKDVTISWNQFGDGPLSKELRSQASLLPGNVNYKFNGYQPNIEIFKYYSSHKVDVFVNVSESEGIPVSIMEAQSVGIPVVATAVGGVPEIIDDKNGVLIDKNCRANDIAAAIEKICFSGSSLYLYRKNSKKRWRSCFSAKNNYSFFCESLKRFFLEL